MTSTTVVDASIFLLNSRSDVLSRPVGRRSTLGWVPEAPRVPVRAVVRVPGHWRGSATTQDERLRRT
jgi:hypothetical protein